MKPVILNKYLTVYEGNCLEVLKVLPDESVQCCVTSPPYWRLRDYGVAGQIGMEATIGEFLDRLIDVFDEVRRVLKPDGTCWVNMGDTYASGGKGGGGIFMAVRRERSWHKQSVTNGWFKAPEGLKDKDLVGMPWRLAFALQSDGWYLRQDIIWHKPNCMPESVTDRCTKSHEYIFLLSKSKHYYFDQETIRERCSESTHARLAQNVQDQIGSARGNGGAKTNGNMKAVARKSWKGSQFHDGRNAEVQQNVGKIRDNLSMDSALARMPEFRNKRSVWTVPPSGYSEAHFAVYPPELIQPCILAGTRPGDVVLDPFGGSGTTGQVAMELGRKALLIELNPDYIALIDRRTREMGLALD